MEKNRILELFDSPEPVFMCAPMVRYSKLPFRLVVRQYGCHVAFTPMIMADSFVKSQRARDADFTTNKDDRPLIVQFAANNGADFALASQLVYRWCDGVDLNCGCPQRWAKQLGVGSCLIDRPDLVKDLVRQARAALPDSSFSVSVKIRLHEDIKKSVELCRQMECAGVSFVTVHGRTPQQRHQPISEEGIAIISGALRVPVVANGDVTCLQQARRLARDTGVSGVMAARGLLQNPALFSGAPQTPPECVQRFVRACVECGGSFSCLHHHLIYMLENSLPRVLRRHFNMLSSPMAVLDFLRDYLLLDLSGVSPASHQGVTSAPRQGVTPASESVVPDLTSLSLAVSRVTNTYAT